MIAVIIAATIAGSWLSPERMPELQTAMAVLAGGPYGVADVAGALNKSLGERGRVV
jgi:hypothetical protein